MRGSINTKFLFTILAVFFTLTACGPREEPAGIEGEPLTYDSASGPTMLVEIPAEESGVLFINELAPENQIKYTYNGAGVAAGDYDGDGLTDIFLLSEQGPDKLFHNLGDFKFEDVTETAGLSDTTEAGGFSIGAYFADIDNDSELDLFITNWKVSNRLFENNGDGTFTDITEEAGLAYVGGATTATFSDYDRDGDLDFFVATYRPTAIEYESESIQLQMVDGEVVVPPDFRDRFVIVNQGDEGGSLRELGERDLLYRNNGDGTFDEVSEQSGIIGGYWGLSATFTDIDNDNWPDLYITNDLWSPDRFYHNNGDGTFDLIDPEMVQHTPWFSMGIDFADINNDGLLDYFIGDMISRDPVLRLTQHGEMDMSPPPPGTAPQVMRNSLYLNNGDGSFSDIAYLADVAATEWTWTAKFADLDLDGFVDLLITNGMVFDFMDSDAAVNIQNISEKEGREAAIEYIQQYPKLDNPDMVFRNMGGLEFEDASEAWGFSTEAVGHGAVVTDLDGDGDLDILVNYLNTPSKIFKNNSGNQRIAVKLTGQASNTKGLGARITLTTSEGTQTRLMTSSGGYLSSHEPIVIFGLGGGTEILELKVEWPSGHVQIFPDDKSGPLAADMKYTITEPRDETNPNPAAPLHPEMETQFQEVAAQAGLSLAHVESAFDDFLWNPLMPRKLSTLGPGVSWADVDSDGDDDLYIAGALDQSGMLYLNNGDGTFSDGYSQLVNTLEKFEELAPLWWYDGTGGDPTLLSSLSKIESAAPLVFRADTAWQASSPVSGGALAAADYDGDGDLDVFAGGRTLPGIWPETAPSSLFENQDGMLVDVTGAAAPDLLNLGQATGAIWLDVDADNDPDLLVASEWGPVHLYINFDGRLAEATEGAGLAEWSGLWTGLTAADFDGDGDLDFAAANIGLNTRYMASPEFPLTLFAGDVDGNGTHDIIETEWDNGMLRPVTERGMMGMQVPAVLANFDTFRGYAEASLEDIFGEGLNNTTRFQATTLAHSIFLNDGAGVFTRRDLPQLAQVTAGYGLTTADFDNDGHADLYLVGNFSDADHMTHSYGGGTSYLLRGLGDGSFEVIPTRDSGLLVPVDARGVAAADYDGDGWTDLAVGVNDGPPRLFHNGGVTGHGFLRVTLAGPAGNPTGVGAQITVTGADGTSTTRVVLAGSGYFSQDSATLVFGLGTNPTATVTVLWPDGSTTDVGSINAGDSITINP